MNDEATIERVARAINTARYALEDEDQIPFEDEDRRGREYAYRLARAAIAALQPQDGWQDIASGLAKALRRLAYHAQTSGGTAGRDEGLVAAVEIGLAALREYDTKTLPAPPAADLERTKG